MPARRTYRPLLTRLYFKLGVLHEMQGIVDRSVLCYQEVRKRCEAPRVRMALAVGVRVAIRDERKDERSTII